MFYIRLMSDLLVSMFYRVVGLLVNVVEQVRILSVTFDGFCNCWELFIIYTLYD